MACCTAPGALALLLVTVLRFLAANKKKMKVKG